MKKRALAAAALCFCLGAAAPGESWHDVTPARAAHGVVVTEQRYATQAGVEVLRAGGNAVDAAVAVAYALAVVDPCCGNIGGGGFMLVRMADGRERFIDFREKAPMRASPNMFLDARGDVVPNASTKGYLAVGVPGTVLGMDRALREFGTRSRQSLMAPAIALASHGFRVQPGDAAIFQGAAQEGYDGSYRFAQQPNVRAIFMRGGRLPQAGDVLAQPQLAATLRLISRDGPSSRAEPAARRDTLDGRLCPVHGRRVFAAALQVSRVRDRRGAPAELGRNDALRDSERRVRLSAAFVGLGFARECALRH